VRYNAAEETFTAVRPLTAADVLFSVQRLCAATDNGYYASAVFAAKLAGCAAGQAAGDGTRVQAAAPDDTTFRVTLTGPYRYFLALSPMWTLRPVPAEVVTGRGPAWTDADSILTTGPFGLVQADPVNGLILQRNPFYPADLWNGGNIDRVEIVLAADVFEEYARYRRRQIDRSDIPLRDLPGIRQNPDYAAELHRIEEPVVYVFGFAHDQPPFDEVQVRRAFAAVLDRQALIDTLLAGNGTPLSHFTPPGLAHAPPLSAPFDVGYDPALARAQMAASSYAGCEGFPPVTIAVFEGAFRWAEYLVSQVATHLGCDPALFSIEELRLDALQTRIDPAQPAGDRPHLFTLGWGPDYADADSFATLLACGPQNFFQRPCTPVDARIEAARSATPAAARDALYAEIEAAFFGPAGEFPLIPLYMNAVYRLKQPWLTGPFATDGRFGGLHYDAYTLDAELIAAARIECNIAGLGTGNLRGGPATTFAIAGKINRGEVIAAVAQTVGRDGFIWWQLITSDWVREDIVEEYGECEQLPEAFAP
jgi:oligopeptide transport system substrate-binding protein